MNAYQEMITRHQAEFNSFPMFFAFSQQQFDDGMQKPFLGGIQKQILSVTSARQTTAAIRLS